MKKVIAIDGYAATGKSTQAKNIAKHLNFLHIDSGAMYRGITYFALKNFWFKNQINIEVLKDNIEEIDINFSIVNQTQIIIINKINVEKELRNIKIDQNVSLVASVPEIRSFLLKKQRQIANKNNIVMDGRDIGSVVFPDSKNKFFLIASPEIRARRRYDQIKTDNKSATLSQILKDVKTRDKGDMSRQISPLKPASDAKIIDTSYLSKELVFDKIISLIEL